MGEVYFLDYRNNEKKENTLDPGYMCIMYIYVKTLQKENDAFMINYLQLSGDVGRLR